jgi:hypothetical protein
MTSTVLGLEEIVKELNEYKAYSKHEEAIRVYNTIDLSGSMDEMLERVKQSKNYIGDGVYLHTWEDGTIVEYTLETLALYQQHVQIVRELEGLLNK